VQIDVFGFGKACKFSPEATDALEKARAVLEKNEETETVFEEGRERMFAGTERPWKRLDALAAQTGMHPFTVHQLFLIFCAEQTRILYQNAGYPETLYWEAMKDLKYKMEETHTLYGIWGTFCGSWLESFFLLKCFCLGRLQFEIIPSEFHHERAGHVLKPHDPVVNVHIPSFGRLAYEEVLDAYARAAKFFGHLFPDGAVWFHCETWILYPQVTALLPEGNLKQFSQDFEIVHACIDPRQDDRFRVFQRPAQVPIAEYPEHTTLQRNLKVWLLEGNTMGMGFGLFLWKNGEIQRDGR